MQLEAVLEAVHGLEEDDPQQRGSTVILELRVARLHLDPAILREGTVNSIDPDKWRPLIMSFQEFYGLGERLPPSRLAEIPEALYLSPDVARARLD